MPHDLDAVTRALSVDREDALVALPWLDETYRAPDAFWAALWQDYAGTASPPPKSRPGEGYDLYHDMVVRKPSKGLAALAYYDRRARKVQSLSYAELHAESARLAGAWAAQKAKAGDVIAVVLPFGRAFLVALCAALRLGLVISFLPPLGDRHLARRLEKLAPAHIATDPVYLGLLDAKAQKLALRDTAAAPHERYERSFTYPAKKPCALVFSPLRDPLDAPVPLSAEAAYLRPLRDARLALSLRPGDTVAAPGAHPAQHQPCLVLATLLAGATFFHLELADLAQDPGLLLQFPLRALGVTTAARDQLLRASPGPLRNVSLWFKNPEEPFDAITWRAFVEAHGLQKTPASVFLFDAADGGMTHFSARRPEGASLKVLPAAGVPWALFDPDGSGQEASGQSGLFAPTPTKKPAQIGHVLLSRVAGSEFLYAGTLAPRRHGRVYPRAEVVDAIADLPFVTAASVVAALAGGAAAGFLFVLLVFTGAEPAEAAAREEAGRTDAIHRRIRARLGDEFTPDRTVFYPLYARMKGKEVDHAWCEGQFQRGSLARKAGQGTFQRLTEARKRFVKDVSGA
ncbi:AMP-binding protein [Sorangium sp. So ce136]|uniref:AMP-binding protein n=1 Tax=Sorangium sp. So ce136 TaxID=3133284 RepID=UPI003F0753A9